MVDEVFDLWGDFDDNGTHQHGDGDGDGGDYFAWLRQYNSTGTWDDNFSADGDDDGDVDGDDLDFIIDHFGNTLTFV